ncbi:MAG: hypothetical protein ACOC95_06365, partial [Planctomycetota bacterium]
RLASVFDPWGRGNLEVSLETTGPESATVTVTGPDFTDTWTWEGPTGQWTPSRIAGSRPDGFAVKVTEDDTAPTPVLADDGD